MLCFWSAKGGAGCSVVAAATAILSARRAPTLLVDLAGGLDVLLGLDDDQTEKGVGDWFAASSPPSDALSRLEYGLGSRLSYLPFGRVSSPMPDEQKCRFLAGYFHDQDKRIVVDLGRRSSRAEPFLAEAGHSVLVSRLCYLAVQAAKEEESPDEIVVVSEPGRRLRPRDVGKAIGAPVKTRLSWDPAVACSVDAGLLNGRLPRSLSVLGRATG